MIHGSMSALSCATVTSTDLVYVPLGDTIYIKKGRPNLCSSEEVCMRNFCRELKVALSGHACVYWCERVGDGRRVQTFVRTTV